MRARLQEWMRQWIREAMSPLMETIFENFVRAVVHDLRAEIAKLPREGDVRVERVEVPVVVEKIVTKVERVEVPAPTACGFAPCAYREPEPAPPSMMRSLLNRVAPVPADAPAPNNHSRWIR